MNGIGQGDYDRGPSGLLDHGLEVVGARFHAVRPRVIRGAGAPIVVANDPVIDRELRFQGIVGRRMRVGIGSKDDQRPRATLLPMDPHAPGTLQVRHAIGC